MVLADHVLSVILRDNDFIGHERDGRFEFACIKGQEIQYNLLRAKTG